MATALNVFSRILLIGTFCFSICNLSAQSPEFETIFEKSNGFETATYFETINFYERLATIYPEINIDSIGSTDSGKPLHLITFNKDKIFDFSEIRKNRKAVLLINSGIHPGEPDGIDATMMLFRDLVQGTIKIPKNTVIVTIPIYNIGGSLNRNSTSRTNQNGPKSYGFRGNARNYDLNRDFIKLDTQNATTFTKIFHLVNPDVFIDNHVSNGADYQYTLSHLFTQHDKLYGDLGNYLHRSLMPELENILASQNWDITPYVNVFNNSPENGFTQFLDLPRYASGYTTLFNTIGLTVETHMLKPYKDRVYGTYEILKAMITITDRDKDSILKLRHQAQFNFSVGDAYPISWKIDSTRHSILNFKGYEAEMIESKITGYKRLKFHRTRPYTKPIAYYNFFKPKQEVTVPAAYVIPRAWHDVIKRLEMNLIEMFPLQKDSIITVESYRIQDYQTVASAFEGHYLHYNTAVEKSTKDITFSKGDIIIPTNQEGVRYIIETLEPEAPDSFFNWNFFDTILQQKEHFSSYVWEDKALEILNTNLELKAEFEATKASDNDFKNNAYAQLDWLHKQSVYYEPVHLQYPIYRLISN